MEKTNARIGGCGNRTPSTTETAADAADIDEKDTACSVAEISPLASSEELPTQDEQHREYHKHNRNYKNPSFSASSSLEEDEDSEEGGDSLPTKAQSAATQSTAATSLSSRTKTSRARGWEKEERAKQKQQHPNQNDLSGSSGVSHNNNDNSNSGLIGYAKSYWNDLGLESASPRNKKNSSQRKGSIRPPPSPRQQSNSPRKAPPPASTATAVSTQRNTTTAATQEEEEVDQPSIFELFERRRQTRRLSQLQQLEHDNKKRPIRFDGSFTLVDIQPETQYQRQQQQHHQQQQQQSTREQSQTGQQGSPVPSGSNTKGSSYPPQQAKEEEDPHEHENKSRVPNSAASNTAYSPQKAKEEDIPGQQQKQHNQTEQQQQQRETENRKRPVRSTRLDCPASSISSPTAASIPSTPPSSSPQPRSRSRNIPKSDSGSSAGGVLPGAYQQAPGRTTTQRNRNIRNSVISTHSMSAQMTGSTTRLVLGASGRSLLSARSSGGSVSTMSGSHRSSNSIPTAERRGRHGRKTRKDNDNDDADGNTGEDCSSEKYSSGEKRRNRRQRRRKQKSSAEDFYEVIPDYAETVQEPPATETTSAVLNGNSSDSKNGGDLNSEEFMYQRKLAASMADLDVDMSLEDKNDTCSRNNNDQISQSSSTRRKNQQNDATKAPPKTSYSAAINKSGIVTKDSPAGEFDDTNILKDKITTRNSPIPDNTINKKGTLAPHAAKGTLPEKALNHVITTPHAPSSLDSGVRIVEEEETKEEIEEIEEQQETVAPLQSIPWRGQSRSPLNSNLSSRSQRMQCSNIGGSNHSMNLSRLNSIATFNPHKMSYVSSESSGELSMTEFKRRVSSMYSLSSSDEDASVAHDMSMRITRNMSTYMRSAGLPVAATVVSSEDALRNEIRQELETEMSEALKREIRLELEVEMAEFRRQLVQEVFSAAEPLTAHVISVEQNGTENSQMTSFQDAQVERQRTEATAVVRSNMHREIGRLYMEMKRGQSANLNISGNSSMYRIGRIDETEEDLNDEEMAQPQPQPQPVIKSKGELTATWSSIWFVFVLAIISGFVLGVGISKFL